MSDTARRILAGILLLGMGGISIELLLMGHYEEFDQVIPLALAAAGILALAAVMLRAGVATIRMFQIVMLLCVVSGLVGAWLHFSVNMEFQLEMDPALKGLALFRKAILAKTPPALAPGAMIQLGLIGLAYTFKHPALTARETP
jgi:predicted membrane channel-forming protein YqfA (hemolysin III family)